MRGRLDEFVRITLDSGEQQHGLVLEVDRGLAVVQVLEDTAGMDPARVADGLRRRAVAHPGRFRLAGPGLQRPW